MGIDTRIEHDEITGPGPPGDIRQQPVQRLQIAAVARPCGQAEINVRPRLAEGKVILAVQADGLDPRLVGKDFSRAVALMHVEIEHQCPAQGQCLE